MKTLVSVLIAGVLVLQAGCLSLGARDGDCDAGRADVAAKRELAELLKLHRLCLQKNEDNATKAKENCSVYREAIHDLIPVDQRSGVMELLERVLDKSRAR